jgi:hypothetical protein
MITSTLQAQWVSACIEVEGWGEVMGAGPHAAYVDYGDFTVAITARGVPLMPNGISVDISQLPKLRNSKALINRDRLVLDNVVVELSGAEVWSPLVSRHESPERTAGRGRAVLSACGVTSDVRGEEIAPSLGDPRGKAGIAALVRAIEQRDIAQASEASALLIGRGPGLTPEGDDLLAGAMASLSASSSHNELVGALLPPDITGRTTNLSATLLRLAARGMVVEPLRGVLDTAGGSDWRNDLSHLLAMGHSTGRAWAVGAGIAMVGGKEPG